MQQRDAGKCIQGNDAKRGEQGAAYRQQLAPIGQETINASRFANAKEVILAMRR
jgi:hypothetical protein